jgi:hypothetical protein
MPSRVPGICVLFVLGLVDGICFLLLLKQEVRTPLRRNYGHRAAHSPKTLDTHYDTIRTAMRGVFQELGLVA